MTREERVIGIHVCLLQPDLQPFEKHILREVATAIAQAEEEKWIAANQHLQALFEKLVNKLRMVPDLAEQINEAIRCSRHFPTP